MSHPRKSGSYKKPMKKAKPPKRKPKKGKM
jgi:hypothetical protein